MPWSTGRMERYPVPASVPCPLRDWRLRRIGVGRSEMRCMRSTQSGPGRCRDSLVMPVHRCSRRLFASLPRRSVIADNGAISPFSMLLYADRTSGVAGPSCWARGSILWRERPGRHRCITTRVLWTAAPGLHHVCQPLLPNPFSEDALMRRLFVRTAAAAAMLVATSAAPAAAQIPTSSIEVTPMVAYICGGGFPTAGIRPNSEREARRSAAISAGASRLASRRTAIPGLN